MKAFFAPLIAVACLGVAHTYGAGNLPLDKVKKGILPSGGFYTIYQSTCHDQRKAVVASTDSQRRWCVQSGATLNCFNRSQEALHAACESIELASAESNN